ncbi:MAG: hypothetical protein JO056_13815 [Alphaproteobacteria bacterium]|nr:hypothetical protein [Alphaproteobacteria bacterium]
MTFRTIIIALVLACAGANAAESAKAPAALEQMRAKFAAAVAARDRTAVAKLSRFPLAIEGYELAPKLTEQKFLRDKNRFDGLFFGGDAQLVTCLKTQPFTYQADAKQFGARLWLLDCNGNEYYFGEDHGHWAFAAYQNINE